MANKPTISDRILLYLYDRQDSHDFINLFNDDFGDVDKIVLRKKTIELRDAGQLEIKPSGHGTAISRWRRKNKLSAKILHPGKLYVKQLTTMKEPKTKIEVSNGGQVGSINTGDIDGKLIQSSKIKSQTADNTSPKPTPIVKTIIKIIVGIIIFVVSALIVWWITGQV